MRHLELNVAGRHGLEGLWCEASQACWHTAAVGDVAPWAAPAPTTPRLPFTLPSGTPTHLPSHPAVKHMLGTRVAAVLDDLDKRLHGELTQLDRFVNEQHAAAAHRRLAREQARWDDAVAAAPTAASLAAVLEGGVQELWGLLQLLPDFKRKTLQAQHVVLFSRQMMEEADRRRAEADRRKAEAAAARAAATGGDAAGEEPEVVDLGESEQQADGAAGPSSAVAAQQQQQQEVERGTAAMEGDAAEGAAKAEAERAAVLQAAEDGAAFIPSASWRGAVPGFCFKLDDSGVGYYRDTPPEVEAFLTVGRVSGAGVPGEHTALNSTCIVQPVVTVLAAPVAYRGTRCSLPCISLSAAAHRGSGDWACAAGPPAALGPQCWPRGLSVCSPAAGRG